MCELLCGLDLEQAWLWDQTANDAPWPGQRERELFVKDKTEVSIDHLDFLMADPHGETRCEVEIMRDELDGSHIVRMMEWCGMERPRYRCGTLHGRSISQRHDRQSEWRTARVFYGKEEIRG